MQPCTPYRTIQDGSGIPSLPSRAMLFALYLIFQPLHTYAGNSSRADGEISCAVTAPASGIPQEQLPFGATCNPSPAGAKYSWDFGDDTGTPFDSISSIRHAYLNPGTYSLVLRIEYQGEIHPIAQTVNVRFPRPPMGPTHSASFQIGGSGQFAWVCNPDQGTVSSIDMNQGLIVWETDVGGEPRTLALGPQNRPEHQNRIWVVVRHPASLLWMDAGSGAILRRIPLPHGSAPYGLVIDPEGSRGYLTLQGTGELLRIDCESGEILGKLWLFPGPRGVAVSPDGKTIAVTRWISPRDHGEVALVHSDPFSLRKVVKLEKDGGPDTKSGGRGVPNALGHITITPDGRRAWVTAKKDNTGRGMRRDSLALSFENTVRAIVCQIDLEGGAEILAHRRDLDNRSLLGAVQFSPAGEFALVAAEGTNEVAVLDGWEGKPVTAIEADRDSAVSLARELGPIGLAWDSAGSRLAVHYFLSRQVGLFDVSSLGGDNVLTRLALISTARKERLEEKVLRGKRLFHNAADTRMGSDGYLSCVVCHMEGGSDGRVWDFTDRGEGLRRTTSLLGRAGTGMGPLHWSANFDEVQDFEHDIRGPQKGLGFMPDADFHWGTRNATLGDKKAGVSPDLDALAAYLVSLNQVRPSPHRNADGSMTAQALRGQDVFNRRDVGCYTCHSTPNFTDSRFPSQAEKALSPSERLKPYADLPGGARSHVTAEGFLVHDVGTLGAASGRRMGDTLYGLDTPTLLGVWEGGPFLHDGAATTVKDVVTVHNKADRHGRTSHLTKDELDNLVAFLIQLDGTDRNGTFAKHRPRTGDSEPRLFLAPQAGALFIRLEGARQDIAASGLRLHISDLSGRVVRRLDPKTRPDRVKGEVTWVWDRRDAQGERSAPGSYFLRAEGLGRGAPVVILPP